MDMNGSQRIEAPREKVYAALNDTEVLKQCVPGCESIDCTMKRTRLLERRQSPTWPSARGPPMSWLRAVTLVAWARGGSVQPRTKRSASAPPSALDCAHVDDRSTART